MSVSPRECQKAKVRDRETIALMVPRESGLLASAGTFWRLCQSNPDLRLERTARGELIVRAPACMDSGMRNLGVSAQLWNWNQTSKLGVAFDSSGGFTLPNRAIRAADASWMTLERWAAVPTKERMKFTRICPDFVIELTSPSDKLVTTREKMREYLEQGVRLGWLLHPKTARAEVYRPGRPVEALRRPATLSGEDVLPGFVLDLKGILFD
jgi:Uma2 family endonuclease